jgi:Arc/MetJ-type ribon-helix-helix transcriptional regulator
MEKKKTKVIATRVTKQLAQAIEKYRRQGSYINTADLIRGALREKLQRDAPQLCKHFLKESN